MSGGGRELRAKNFLEDFPECAEALRYLLKQGSGWSVLQEVCDRFRIGKGLWVKCYSRFGWRNGLGWIETRLIKERHCKTRVRIIPENSIREKLQELLAGGSNA